MVDPILAAEGIRMRYGMLEVLKGVDLEVAAGEVFAIIGPNGAGKTSLFKTITGEVRCTGGTIRFAGKNVTTMPAFQRTRMGMSRTFQVARIFPDFTALNNVSCTIEARERAAGRASSAWYGIDPAAGIVVEAESILERMGLAERRHDEAKFLSHGDKKRLELAIALAQRPRILMLDEPTAGMAISDRASVVELIAEMKRQLAITIVLTEHDMDVVFGLADRLAVLNYGEIISVGTVAEVRANPLVREVYLGKEIYHA